MHANNTPRERGSQRHKTPKYKWVRIVRYNSGTWDWFRLVEVTPPWLPPEYRDEITSITSDGKRMWRTEC
jgi:hypothetical protein